MALLSAIKAPVIISRLSIIAFLSVIKRIVQSVQLIAVCRDIRLKTKFVLLINFIIACRPISGASMNPARSIGPALVMHIYSGLWVYIVGPLLGTFLGSSAYNLIRFTDKPLNELSRSSSFLKSVSRSRESFQQITCHCFKSSLDAT